MGVKFFDRLIDREFFVCRNCDVNLTDKKLLLSTEFTSLSGPAFLFDKVTNVEHGKSELRDLSTGPHYVRDVFCKGCAVKVGWFYEFAAHKSQEYKEGKTVLEESLICEKINDFMD